MHEFAIFDVLRTIIWYNLLQNITHSKRPKTTSQIPFAEFLSASFNWNFSSATTMDATNKEIQLNLTIVVTNFIDRFRIVPSSDMLIKGTQNKNTRKTANFIAFPRCWTHSKYFFFFLFALHLWSNLYCHLSERRILFFCRSSFLASSKRHRNDA